MVNPWELSKSNNLCVKPSPPHPVNTLALPKSLTTKSVTAETSHFPYPTSTIADVDVAKA